MFRQSSTKVWELFRKGYEPGHKVHEVRSEDLFRGKHSSLTSVLKLISVTCSARSVIYQHYGIMCKNVILKVILSHLLSCFIHELAGVYSRLLLSFILLMMDVESFGRILHHNNGAVMRVTQPGMYVMKVKRQMNLEDMILQGKNQKTGMKMRTFHLLMDAGVIQQTRQRSVGIL